MTTPFWCLLIVSILPYLLAFTGAYFKTQQFGRVDNNLPRVQASKLEGMGARAWAAQSNAWEALTVFAPAVIVAHLCNADAGSSATASMVFVAMRIAHPLLYLADMATPRSAVFSIGIGCVFYLYRLAAIA